MWVVDKIFVSMIPGIVDRADTVSIPYLVYDKQTRSRLKHIWVTLREYETGNVRDIYSNERSWGRLSAALKKFNPYGCVNFHTTEDNHVVCQLVAVDALSYQFLEFVEGFTPVVDDFALEVVRRRHFISLDNEKTLFNIRIHARAKYGFPLMKIIMSTPENWDEFGNCYIAIGDRYFSVFRVDFSDKAKVRAFLGKASLVCGENPVKAGIQASKSIFL